MAASFTFQQKNRKLLVSSHFPQRSEEKDLLARPAIIFRGITTLHLDGSMNGTLFEICLFRCTNMLDLFGGRACSKLYMKYP